MQEALLSPGQKINIKPFSSIYKGPYEVEILEVSDNIVKITIPFKEGKIILPSVGTGVEVTTEKLSFESEILEKNHSGKSYLTLKLPLIFKNITGKKFKEPKIIAVASGKGGVGKTHFVINTAISLALQGLRTLVIDADLGTANVDILLNLQTKHTLQDLIEGKKKSALDIVVEGPAGISVIPGGAGFQFLADLPEEHLLQVIEKLAQLKFFTDIILIDTGAGISKNTTRFALAADETIVLTTPEPHAIADAYALIKVLNEKNYTLPTSLIVNRVDSKKEAHLVLGRMENVVERFLSIRILKLGYIFEDSTVRRAVKNSKPFILMNPACPASKCISDITKQLNPFYKDIFPTPSSNKTFAAKLKKIFQLS